MKNYNVYKELAKGHTVVPVFEEIDADMETPVSLYIKVGGEFLLESLEQGAHVGRYSILGMERILTVTLKGRTVETVNHLDDSVSRVETTDFLMFLGNLIKAYEPPQLPELPPFWGGLVGYLGYETAGFIESIPLAAPEADDIPDAILVVPRTVIICDSVKRTALIVSITLPGRGLKEEFKKARERIEAVIELITKQVPTLADSHCLQGVITGYQPSSGDFVAMVNDCKEHIRAGDIIQAVLSRSTFLKTDEAPFSLYRKLRRANPSPYMFFLDYGEFVLAGSSPEVMVRVQGNELFLKPIAGTRPRGKTVKEDSVLAEELLQDPKERAEHLMLVDLGRNDIGKVAAPGSVEVTNFMTVEKFSHVMHLVSSVRGRLRAGLDSFDVIRATFPAGTLTGAPKIRAMEIISKLEGNRRGHYGGMILYLGFSGNMDSCITIRSMVCRNGVAAIRSGAGIVADSIPENELKETEDKAGALIAAVTGKAGLR